MLTYFTAIPDNQRTDGYALGDRRETLAHRVDTVEIAEHNGSMINRSSLSRLSRRRILTWAGLSLSLGALSLTPRESIDSLAKATEQHTNSLTNGTSKQSPAITTPPPPLNYLHTAGATIRDASGAVVTLTGINWFGMETGTLAPHGLWLRSYADMLDQIVQLGYNCLRLPFSSMLFTPALTPNGIDFSKNPDLKGLSGLQILDTIVVAAGQRGLKLILDQHRPDTQQQSPLWYTDRLSQEVWVAQWVALAKRYLGNDAVIGADLHNEPAGPATWGSGDPKTDWRIAAEMCGNAILGVNSNWLIFVEGVEKLTDASGNPIDWTWMGGELMNAGKYPVELKTPNRLVYSPHDYGPTVSGQSWFSNKNFPDNMPAFWDKHWGYLQKKGIAPILVGEFGGTSVGKDPDGIWQRSLVSYLKTNHFHYTYWCLNPNSGDTGGLLEDDWLTVNPGKQALLKTYQGAPLKNVAPRVVNAAEIPPPVSGTTTPQTATALPTSQPTMTPSPTSQPTNTSTPTEATPTALPTPSQTASPLPTITDSSSQTYVVETGDTLTSIAVKMYGDPNLWTRIYDANATRLTNPNQIRPGQELVIPKA